MTGKSDKQARFWNQQEIKSWHPQPKKGTTSRDHNAANKAGNRVKQPTQGKRAE
jgi:hypothetical protein